MAGATLNGSGDRAAGRSAWARAASAIAAWAVIAALAMFSDRVSSAWRCSARASAGGGSRGGSGAADSGGGVAAFFRGRAAGLAEARALGVAARPGALLMRFLHHPRRRRRAHPSSLADHGI